MQTYIKFDLLQNVEEFPTKSIANEVFIFYV